MENSPPFAGPAGLQHIPGGTALALGSTRAGILTRGRRDSANSPTNPHYRQAVEHFHAGNFASAAAAFQRAAEAGHAESQFILSTLYQTGQGLPPDDAQSAHWARLAAEAGHREAQAALSFRHYTAGELAEAFRWCQRAADSNLPWAQYNLGLLYRKGEGTAQSDADAAYWYRLAALQGHPEAQQKLAALYYLGQGVRRSYTEAAHWYQQAADQGNAEAQFQLGHLYEMGLGVDHDYAQYRHYTRQAALQGHEEALRELKRREYRDP